MTEDQEAPRNARWETNARLFAILRNKHRGLAEVYRRGAEREAAAAEAVDDLEDAHASRPMTQAEIRRVSESLGMTDADMRHYFDLNALCELVGEDRVVAMLASYGVEAGDRAVRRATRQLLAAFARRATEP